MESKSRLALIVGLGNPGKEYENTRHNMGFQVLRAFAERYNWTFKKQRDFKGEFAHGSCKEKKVILLLPTTYMNLSGQSVRKVFDFYKFSLEDVLVVTDDVALPFGTLRFRERGSAGGHNGLKSIESQLGTQEYSRLRIGIGDREHGLLEDYVLSCFTKDEKEKLPAVIDEAVAFLEKWLEQTKEIYEETK